MLRLLHEFIGMMFPLGTPPSPPNWLIESVTIVGVKAVATVGQELSAWFLYWLWDRKHTRRGKSRARRRDRLTDTEWPGAEQGFLFGLETSG